MKKNQKIVKFLKAIVKSRIFAFVSGAVIFSIIGAGAATYFASGDVSYDNTESGLKSTDVQSAIDELYQLANAKKPIELIENAVTSGDGLYADSYEAGRYIYRGSNPNNYITYNNETWRIMSIEKDGTIKIVRNAVLLDRAYDTTNGRYSSSGYCNNSSYGCNIWGSSSTLYNASGSAITTLPREVGGTAYTLPTAVSDLNTYLNGTYYNSTLSSTARGQIESSWFNVGPVSNSSSYTLTQNIEQSKAARWKGNIGLIDAIEYVKASTNSACDSVYDFYSNSSCYNDPQNYLNISDIFWTLSPYSDSGSYLVVRVYSGCRFSSSLDFSLDSRGVRPAISLKSDISLSGEGTESNPYTIIS